MPNSTIVTIEAAHNSRVQAGIYALEDQWILEEGFAVYPNGHKNYIQVSLEVDLGRFDSEGDNYIVELLNIVPGDLICCYQED